MTQKPTYNELEQRVKELEAFEAKCEEKVVAFERLFDLSLDMLCIADMNAYFKQINKAFEKTLGYTKEELLKESFLQFIHPNDIASTIVEVEKLSLGKPTIYFENRYRCKDNSYKWLAWTSMPDLEHGLMYAVAHDITEHKLIEQALLESEERYRLLFSEMVSGFALHEIICDKNGKPYDYRFLDLNPAFERLTGLRRIDILGKTVREVLPKIETYWIETYGEVALSGKPAHFENYSEELNRYYEVFAFRPQKGQFAVTFTDITAHKQAEEALRESEKRYKLLADNVTDVIWIRDMNLNITYISPSVMGQLGYTVEEAKARTLEETWTPESLKYIREVFAEELEIEKDKQKDMNRSRTIEVETKCKDGSTIWAEAKMSFLRDKNGEPIEIIGVTRDITERKHAEEALLEKEHFLQNVFDGMQDGICVLDTELNIIRVNQCMEKLYGDHKALIGRKCYKIYQQRGSMCPWCPSIKAIKTGEPQSEIVPYPTEVNPERWIDLSSYPMKDAENKVLAVIEQVKDITDRKLAEEALRESEEKYRLLVESTPDWVWMCDRKSRHTFSNNAVKDILGYEIHEILGTAAPSLIHKEDRKSVQKWFQKAKKQKRGWRGSVIRWQHKDKSIRFLETIAEPILDDKGNLIGYLGIDRDVTARKLSEMALQKAHDELQEKTISLEAKKKSLEEINTAMRVLLKKREKDKTKIEKSVLTNVKKLIEPYLEKIKKTRLNDQQRGFLRIVESNLNEIISPFTQEVSLKYFNLTSTEIQIAKQIRHGHTTKKIAAFMNVSPRTVETHRKNIRRKIGLEGKRANLRSHLLSIK